MRSTWKIVILSAALALLLALTSCDLSFLPEILGDTTTTESTDLPTDGDQTTTAEPDDPADGSTTEEPVLEKQPDGTLPFVPQSPERINYDWKAMWFSQFDMMQAMTAGGRQRTESQFRTRMAKMLDNAKGDHYNTIIVQVRPNADSAYPSEYFPPSRYAVGAYGGTFEYDPFAIIIEMCRERELKVHAWINPMRAMSTSEIEQIDGKYQIKQWYDNAAQRAKFLREVDGYWYLNIAYPEVRKLIVDGVGEIMEKYDVDGIHMDDYFYPTTDPMFDFAAYSLYARNGGKLDQGSWRRENLNVLVSELYAETKSHSLRALFGISPAGNLNTVYNTQYADVNTWCANPGYIDYICPQIYFGFEHSAWPFEETCHRWQDLIKTDYVTLLVGVSFGNVGNTDKYAGTGVNEWKENYDVMVRQLRYTQTLDKCAGISVFCYKHIFDLSSGARIAGQVGYESTLFKNDLPNATFKYVAR